MKAMTRRKALCACLVVGLVTSFTSSRADAGSATAPIAVVVSKDITVEGMSLYELKRLYLGNDMIVDGKRAVPLNRGSQTSERKGFDESVLGMSPEDVARHWIDQRLRGKKGAPKAVEPASVVKRVVSKLPGAIGYLRLSEIDSSVKVLEIDGKKPGDAGYPVHAGRESSQAQSRAAGRGASPSF